MLCYSITIDMLLLLLGNKNFNLFIILQSQYEIYGLHWRDIIMWYLIAMQSTTSGHWLSFPSFKCCWPYFRSYTLGLVFQGMNFPWPWKKEGRPYVQLCNLETACWKRCLGINPGGPLLAYNRTIVQVKKRRTLCFPDGIVILK